MQYFLLFALLFHTGSAVRVVVTFNSAQDRLDAQPSSITGSVQKSYGRRHVLLLEDMTYAEAQELLPFAYSPVPLVSIEEDLVLIANTNMESDLPMLTATEVSGAVVNVSGLFDNSSVMSGAGLNVSGLFENSSVGAEVSGAVLKVSGALGNSSVATTVLQWNLFGGWGIGLLPEHLLVSLENTTVAILDSGFNDYDGGYDFISDIDLASDGNGRDADASDVVSAAECTPSWHGTQMASVIRGSQALGLRGIADTANMLSVRVLGDCDKGLASDVTDAVVWAAGGTIDGVETNVFPAKIISMSFTGKGGCPSYLQSAVYQAVRLGSIAITWHVMGSCLLQPGA